MLARLGLGLRLLMSANNNHAGEHGALPICLNLILIRCHSSKLIPITYVHVLQERMIKRGGGRGCNFRRFWTRQNNPPVLLIEHSLAREILIAWHDPVCTRVRVYVPYSSYNGKFWMC